MPPRRRRESKARRGTLRPDRERPALEMKPADVGAPPAPLGLDADVRAHYDALAAEMDAQRLATRGDGAAILLAASARADFDRHRAFLREHGESYAHNGLIRVRPECALMADAWRRCLLALRALGLAPAARGTVEPLTPAAPPDAMESLLRAQEGGRP